MSIIYNVSNLHSFRSHRKLIQTSTAAYSAHVGQVRRALASRVRFNLYTWSNIMKRRPILSRSLHVWAGVEGNCDAGWVRLLRVLTAVSNSVVHRSGNVAHAGIYSACKKTICRS